jgi:hypothetical protein
VQLFSEEQLKSAKAKFDLLNYLRKDLLGNVVETDPVRTAELVSQIDDSDLPEFMFYLAVTGNLQVMHALQVIKGPISVEYVYKPGERRQHTVNRKAFSPERSGVLSHCTSVAELKAFFSTIKSYGFKGIVEPGLTFPFLFTESDCSGVLSIVKEASFLGELPFLDAGRLKSPELAICLSDESCQSATPEAYMPILCWATEAMIKEFGDSLKPLSLLQRVSYDVHRPLAERAESDLYRCASMPAATFKKNAKTNDEAVVTEITLGLDEYASHSEWAGNLNRYMGNEFTRRGFPSLDGRVLCEARVDFLLNFPAALCTKENLLESKRFVDGYFPFDILAIQTLKACSDNFGHPPKSLAKYTESLALSHRNAFNRVFEDLSEKSPVRERMLDMFTREQWLGLAKNCEGFSLTVEALIALRDTLGLDNRGLALSLVPGDLDTLSNAGYRFVDDTQSLHDWDFLDSESEPDPALTCVKLDLSGQAISFTLENDSGDKILDEAVRLHGLVQSMNLWICKTPKPTSIKQALAAIVDLNITNPSHQQAMALYAFLVGQGIAACAKEAISPEEWVRLTEMFSDEEISPYLKIMPGKARGRALESQLGL